MSAEWPEVRLEDVTSILGDGLHGTPVYDEFGEYYFINGNNLRNGKIEVDGQTKRTSKNEFLKHRKNLNDRTILVSINGTIGNVGVYDGEKVILGKSACYFNVIEEVDKQFVRYVITSKNFQDYIHSLATGSTIKNVSLKLMRNFTFKLPPLDIQKNISKVLEDLDNKIELNRQINQTLEQIAQTIFKSWFVDFEPVKAKIGAKAAGRDPERAAMCAISGKLEPELNQLTPEQRQQLAATAALFPDELVESELGLIPQGWENQELSKICQFTAGSGFKPEYQGQTEGEYPFIKVSDMNFEGNEIFIRSSQNYVFETQRKAMNAKLHPSGATVFAKIGVALLSNRRRLLRVPTIVDNNMMSAAPRNGESLSYYLFLLLSSIDFTIFANGTALPYLNVSDLQKIQVVVPFSGSSKAIWQAFNEIVTPLFEGIYANSNQSETLTSLRDSLLPKLFSGEVSLDKGF